MRIGRLFCAAVLMLGTVSAVAHAAAGPGTSGRAALVIHVLGASPAGGILRLGVYDKAGYPGDKNPVVTADVPARPGETVITLSGLAPGTYAIEVYQDINGNGQMDMTWIGLPLEPYGFSRDARPVLSKPGFASVSFVLKAGHNEQSLHLQNVDVPGE